MPSLFELLVYVLIGCNLALFFIRWPSIRDYIAKRWPHRPKE